jgi:hypothetical protein
MKQQNHGSFALTEIGDFVQINQYQMNQSFAHKNSISPKICMDLSEPVPF